MDLTSTRPSHSTSRHSHRHRMFRDIPTTSGHETLPTKRSKISRLRHVIDRVPRKVWISLLVSGAERFTYYAISTPWRESLPDYCIASPAEVEPQKITCKTSCMMAPFQVPLSLANLVLRPLLTLSIFSHTWHR